MMTSTSFSKYCLRFRWGFQEHLFNMIYSRHSFCFPCQELLLLMILSWCCFLIWCILSYLHFFLSINYKWKVPSSEEDHLSHSRDLLLLLSYTTCLRLFHFFSNVGFFPIPLVLTTFRTISYIVPKFLTSIAFYLIYVFIFLLRTELPKFPFPSYHSNVCLILLIWSDINFCLQSGFFNLIGWP